MSAAPAEAKKKALEFACVTETVVIKANFDKTGAPVTGRTGRRLTMLLTS
jgi:hypothetical protein